MSDLLNAGLCRCVDLLIAAGRVPEAAFFTRTYLPSRITEVRLHLLLTDYLFGALLHMYC